MQALDPVERVAEVMARPMVAVFPFEQETYDPADAYFVDGFAEDLMAELASWRWFPILSRNAAFASIRRDMPIAERAAALGARYAVGGRIQRVGQRARLSVELVDASSGAQLWSARFERDVAGLVEMQAQIAGEVFQRIAPELTSAERRRILLDRFGMPRFRSRTGSVTAARTRTRYPSCTTLLTHTDSGLLTATREC